MDRIELQRLRDLPIEGVAGRLGLSVTRHRSLCPFHDDHTPSLGFKNNKFRCWSCGARGDTISLAEQVLGKDFLDACRWLANEHNVILTSFTPPADKPLQPFDASRYERFFEHPWLIGEARRFLFDERRLDPRVVRWCRLTSWRDRQGVPWLQTPYYDRQGKLIGVQNRNLSVSGAKGQGTLASQAGQPGAGVQGPLTSPAGQPAPRFRFPAGSQCGIYNLPILNLLRPGEALYITEGCSDCWAMLSAGHKAIAIPSATLLTPKDKEILATIGAPSPHPAEGRLQSEDAQTTSSPSLHHPTEGRLQSEDVQPSPRAGSQDTPRTEFHMYPDCDEPGERLFLQLRQVLPSLVHHQLPPGCKDFSEYYLKVKN